MDLDRTSSVTATTAGRSVKEEREIKKHKIRCNFNQGLEFKAKSSIRIFYSRFHHRHPKSATNIY